MQVVLISGWSISGYHVLRALRAIGATVYLIYDRRSVSLRYSLACKPIYRIPDLTKTDPREIATQINNLHHHKSIDCVIGSDLDSLLLIEQMRDIVAPPVFPMTKPEVLLQLHNKWEFFRTCRELSINVPNCIRVRSGPMDPDEVARTIGFPLVIKPTALYGQRGLIFIRDKAQLIDNFIVGDYPYRDVIMQEFVPGQDWGMSVMARNGLITHWTTFLCLNYVSAQFRENYELFRMVEKIIAATEFTGVANFDARLDTKTGSLHLFECNPRFFLRTTAARLNGLNFVKAGLCPEKTPLGLSAGDYFHWRDILTHSAMRAIVQRTWKVRTLVQDLYEMFLDPLPILIRRMTGEAGQQ